MAFDRQREMIHGLHDIGEIELADRLDTCMASRRNRYSGDGWPWLCRSVACVWCRRPLTRAWWGGICDWAADEPVISLGLVPIRSGMSLPTAVRRLRRGLRDVRDRRMARRRRRWRKMAFAGLAGGDRVALVVISHEAVDRREVLDVLRRRWSRIVLTDLEQQEPAVAMTVEDAVDLGRCRRGAEPLRIVVPPRRDSRPAMEPVREPMPVVV